MSANDDRAVSAAAYAAHGWALVPIHPGTKGPRTKGWNLRANCKLPPGWAGNIGLAHAYSGTCCIDFDDLERATAFLKEHGIDASALLIAPDAVRISSGRPNRAKLLYRLATPLRSLKLADGALELRCATSQGTTVQDVLPPSIHPTTGLPYTWEYGDDLAGSWRALPELPEALHKLWVAMTTHEAPAAQPAALQYDGDEAEFVENTRATLAHHDPDCSYDGWLKVGMALHHGCAGGSIGLDLWDEWSAQGSKYRGREDLAMHYGSFRSDGPGPKVTLASLTPHATPDLSLMETIELATATKEVAQPIFDCDRSGRKKPTLHNLELALTSADWTGWQLCRDSFRDEIMIAPQGTPDWRPFNDENLTQLMLDFERKGFSQIERTRMRDTVSLVASRLSFDSAQLWLNGLTWDGKPRVDRFLMSYAGAADTPYTAAVSRYLWSALAGRVLSPGCQVDMVPILIGEQGIRKTTGVKALVPQLDHYVEIDLGERDEDLSRIMRGRLVGEIGELRGLSSKDVESIKTFISRTEERWVPKYKEWPCTFARRVVFIGTTNQREFLQDETGNRRWLPVEVTTLDVERITADRLQLWAEGAALWRQGGVAWQDAERLGRAQHAAHMVSDPWEEPIRAWLAEPDLAGDLGVKNTDIHPPRGARFFTTAEVQAHALLLPRGQMNSGTARRVARLLKLMGYQPAQQSAAGERARGWVNPQKPANSLKNTGS